MSLAAIARSKLHPDGRPGIALGLLIAAWSLAVVASYVGEPSHGFAPKLVIAFLLWRVWRGARWSRYLLIVLSTIAAGFVAGLLLAIDIGASGINTRALTMFAIYALVGALLGTTPIRGLSATRRTVTV